MTAPISIVIPAYKEHDNIVPVVQAIHATMSGYNYRILFVDDNSRDGSEELVADLSKQKYPVDIMVRKDKRGLASAVVDGIAKADSDTIIVMDADLQHPPDVLPRLLKTLDDGADVALGSRYVPGGGCVGWGLGRRIISKGAIFICHLLLPATRGIKDPMSGFFSFRRKVIDGAELKPAGYKILLEILLLGKPQHVAEVPFMFRTRSRGESKLSAGQQVDYLKHLYSLMRRTGELARFIKFGLVGASGIVVNEGLLFLLRDVLQVLLPVSSAIAIEASIISNFILNDTFTFSDRRKRSGPMLARGLKFNVVSLAGAAINWGTLLFFTEVVGIHHLVSNLIGIALAFLFNYAANSWWTWR